MKNKTYYIRKEEDKFFIDEYDGSIKNTYPLVEEDEAGLSSFLRGEWFFTNPLEVKNEETYMLFLQRGYQIGSECIKIHKEINSSDYFAMIEIGDRDFEWTENKVIDFVNWYLKVKKLDFRYSLENRNIIQSFIRGDAPEAWHQNKFKE